MTWRWQSLSRRHRGNRIDYLSPLWWLLTKWRVMQFVLLASDVFYWSVECRNHLEQLRRVPLSHSFRSRGTFKKAQIKAFGIKVRLQPQRISVLMPVTSTVRIIPKQTDALAKNNPLCSVIEHFQCFLIEMLEECQSPPYISVNRTVLAITRPFRSSVYL